MTDFRWRGAAAVAAFGLLVAGCTAGTESAPPAPSSSVAPPPGTSAAAPTSTGAGVDATVAWMDGFCGAVNGFRDDQNKTPTVPPGNTEKEIRAGTSQQMGYYGENLSKAVDRLNGLPASPVPAVETVKKKFLEKYTSARDKVVGGKAKLDAAAKNSNAAQESAVDAMISAQSEVQDLYDPVGAIMDIPELTAASAIAPECRP
jgi:hypothetical protein